jgi:hypothetical protein
MNDGKTIRRKPNPDEAANIVDRYRRGQGIEFIRMATDFGRPRIVEAIKAAGVPLRKGKHRGPTNRNWGYTGGCL